jgi:hypothetical protein
MLCCCWQAFHAGKQTECPPIYTRDGHRIHNACWRSSDRMPSTLDAVCGYTPSDAELRVRVLEDYLKTFQVAEAEAKQDTARARELQGVQDQLEELQAARTGLLKEIQALEEKKAPPTPGSASGDKRGQKRPRENDPVGAPAAPAVGEAGRPKEAGAPPDPKKQRR